MIKFKVPDLFWLIKEQTAGSSNSEDERTSIAD